MNKVWPVQLIEAGASPGEMGLSEWVAQPVVRDEETLAFLHEFINEASDGLNKAEQVLLEVEKAGPDPERVNKLFRVFGTIKDLSSLLSLAQITELGQQTETLLNQVREGKIPLADAVLDLVFDATEKLRLGIDGVQIAVERGAEVAVLEALAPLLAKLRAASDGVALEASVLPVASPTAKIGDILEQIGAVAHEQVEQALEAQKESGRKFGEELIAQGAIRPKDVAQAIRAQTRAQTDTALQAGKIQETLKVDVARIDRLVEMIGELVIVESMVVHSPEILKITAQNVRNYLGQLSRITRELQDIGMRMRMVPVRGVFQKMARLVRDLGKKMGKEATLITSGEGSEIDRSMVDQLSDPLVHMIRNSMDHGLESADKRARAGKGPCGTIWLSAYHQGGSIVIEFKDDGQGLNREAILAKARETGIVKGSERPSDAELDNLIFAPGFSTAKVVTEVSGRGVGMDVVRKNIEGMRGRVRLSSVPGQGTTFRMFLPLTMAIIDGMILACGKEHYIIPTLQIIEALRPTREMITSFAGRSEQVNIRSEILPLVRLAELLGVAGAKTDPTEAQVMVLESGGKKIGLMVDEVQNQQQVVIKSLGSGLSYTQYLSGAAILSDGRVGLILNGDAIVHRVEEDKAGEDRLRPKKEKRSSSRSLND